MRWKHYIAFVVASVIMWLGIINYLFKSSFIYSSDISNQQMLETVENLEKTLDIELKNTELLIRSLRNILENFDRNVSRNNEDKATVREEAEKVHIRKIDSYDSQKHQIEQYENKKLRPGQSLLDMLKPKEEQHEESQNTNIETIPHADDAIPVLVFACNRVTVSRCLDRLIKYRPSKDKFPIIVSQDCGHLPTAEAIKSYGDEVYHIRQPDLSDIPVPEKEKKFKGYFKIARHYGWALNQTFVKYKFNAAVIVEDDLDIAEDFFEYFSSTLWLLQTDPTLWCVSAWNDNGKRSLIDLNSPELLYRTDFFPGLGWMLTASVWSELMTKWPRSYWDDWIREPEQRKNRACIRPEISRTRTFGKLGVSNGFYYDRHLKNIHLNEQYVKFTTKDLSYLLKEDYDKSFLDVVNKSPPVPFGYLKSGLIGKGPVRILYKDKNSFKRLCKLLGLMDDFRSGVPRTAYLGIISLMYNNVRVYLTPANGWQGYSEFTR